MQCPNCKGQNRDQAEFCAWCGTKLPRPTSAETAVLPAPEPAASKAPAIPDARPVPGAATADTAVPPAPTAAPLQPGALLGERYLIKELLASSPLRNRYKAVDLAYCRACGAETNTQADQYCRSCGAALEPYRTVIFEEELRVAPAVFDIHLTFDQMDYYGVYEPEAVTAQPAAVKASKLRWGLASDQGRQRDHNEDYLEGWIYSRGDEPLLALFVVADGLGGQDSGEVASKLTADTLWQHIKTAIWEPLRLGQTLDEAQYPAALQQAAQAANAEVYRIRMDRGSQMSSTLTTALVAGATAYVANVGDSRTYVFGPQGLQRITKDHSLVQRLVDTGQIKPEEIYTHPRRNLIYQSIGDRNQVQVDLFTRRLASEERLVLCSDGLWEMVHDEGLEEVLMAESDPQLACDRLVKNANLAGGEDNISVIIVQLLP
ncbi:MAG: PP2C family serine/threonine-protein phosphatase [Anaerolineae bacterium]